MISVIIPIYNAENTLKDCLNSIILQDLTDKIEIICINDASTDQSKEIVSSYIKNNYNIYLIDTNKNIGSGKARNLGLKKATGDYILFCDADDLYPPYAFEILYHSVKKSNSDFAAGNIRFMDSTMQHALSLPDRDAAMVIGEEKIVYPRDYAPLWKPAFHQRFLFKKEFLIQNNIVYPNFLRGQDPPMLARALCCAKQASVVPHIVYTYRVSAGKLNSAKKVNDSLKALKMTINVFRKYNYNKQADMHIVHSAQIACNISFYRYSKKQRQDIISLYTYLFSTITTKNFSPYTDGVTEKDFFIIKNNIFIYILRKVIKKIKQLLG